MNRFLLPVAASLVLMLTSAGDASPPPPSSTAMAEQDPGARGPGAVPEEVEHALDLYNDALASAQEDPDAARTLFAEAAAVFDAVEVAGPVSAEFYRAQGNAHFFAGDIGPAVLAYRRGLERKPGDKRLLDSLAVARAAVKTAYEPGVAATLPETLARWRRFVPQVVVGVVFAASWGGLWGVLIVGRLRGGRPRAIIVAALASCSLVTASALGAETWRRADRSPIVLIAEAEAFNGPSREVYEPTFAAPLSAGVEASVLESRLGWCRISLRTGSETWVREEAVAPVRPPR